MNGYTLEINNMETQKQLKGINKRLRERAEGLKGIDIAIKSGIAQPSVSGWLRGIDAGINMLEKLAYALGMKIVIELKQDWESGERDGLGED